MTICTRFASLLLLGSAMAMTMAGCSAEAGDVDLPPEEDVAEVSQAYEMPVCEPGGYWCKNASCCNAGVCHTCSGCCYPQ